MTRVCCPSCRLRFTGAATAFATICPECSHPLQPVRAQDAVGFRLFASDDALPSPPAADGNAAAASAERHAVMGDWNVRLLEAAVRRARNQVGGPPFRDG
jgi:hypothetical protein